MTHRLLPLIACLVAGLVASLAVAALGRGVAVDFDVGVGGETGGPAARRARLAQPGWPATPGFGVTDRRGGVTRVVALHHVPGGRLHAAWELTTGWPVRCVRRGVRLTSPPAVQDALHARVVRGGLALDTAFYGSVFFLLLRACYGVRVLTRRKENADADVRMVAVRGAAGGRAG